MEYWACQVFNYNKYVTFRFRNIFKSYILLLYIAIFALGNNDFIYIFYDKAIISYFELNFIENDFFILMCVN